MGGACGVDKLEEGPGHFEFDPFNGAKDGALMTVYCFMPSEFDEEDSKIFMVMHGAGRDAEEYFDALVATGEPERLGVVLVVPHFNGKLFPKAPGYNYGNVFKGDPEEEEKLPSLRSRELWAFTALERCFDEVKARTGSQAEDYILCGHSAGSQFAHRFTMLYGAGCIGNEGEAQPPFRAGQIICANAGWYTMPTAPAKHNFPYGLGGIPRKVLHKSDGRDLSEEEVHQKIAAKFVQAPITVLLGVEDTNPKKPAARLWKDTPEANEQGKHRFERGHAFFNAGKNTAKQLGVPFNWQMKYVPGVGHSGAKMLAVALTMACDPDLDGEVDTSVLEKVTGEDLE